MKKLSHALTMLFSPSKKRGASPDYVRFRQVAKAHGLKYRITRDNFLEVDSCPALPRGLKTAHLDWFESADRVQHCIKCPDAVDRDGYYGE